jgi:hypothetical protein
MNTPISIDHFFYVYCREVAYDRSIHAPWCTAERDYGPLATESVHLLTCLLLILQAGAEGRQIYSSTHIQPRR